MIEVRRIPQPELKRIADANSSLVDVAGQLLQLARKTDDQTQKAALELAVSRLLSSSNAISAAVRSTAYLTAA